MNPELKLTYIILYILIGTLSAIYILITADFPINFSEIKYPFLIMCLSTVATLHGMYYLLFE